MLIAIGVKFVVQPKSVLKNRKSDFDGILDDDESPAPDSPEDSSQPNNIDLGIESNVNLYLDTTHIIISFNCYISVYFVKYEFVSIYFNYKYVKK